MNIKHLTNDNLAVRVIREEKTDSGIYYGAVSGHVDVIKDAREHIQDDILRAEVIFTGPGRKTTKGLIHPMEVKVGDIVRFDCKLGIELPGSNLLLLSERAVLAVESDES